MSYRAQCVGLLVTAERRGGLGLECIAGHPKICLALGESFAGIVATGSSELLKDFRNSLMICALQGVA